jgi:hypothetical protein
MISSRPRVVSRLLILSVTLAVLLGCLHKGPIAAPLSSADGAQTSGTTDPISAEEAGLRIHVFTLGQADSMLVLGPAPQHRSLLIDLGGARGGDRKNHLRVAERIEEITGRRGVDYFLVSHFHADHVGMPARGKGKPTGMFALLDDPKDRFTIGTWMDRGDDDKYAARTKAHQGVLANMDTWISAGRVGSRVLPELGTGSIDLGDGVIVEVLSVAGSRSDGKSALAAIEAESPGTYEKAPASENDFSIALLISRGDFELFTAGDLTGAAWPGEGKEYPNSTDRSFGKKSSTYTNVERWLVEDWQKQGRKMDVEIYRANHHGSSHSSTEDLLTALDPEFILYSCGGLYGHPDPEVVERGAKTARQLVTYAAALKSWPQGIPTQWGSVVGEIPIAVSMDGHSYTIAGENQPSWNDKDESSGKDVRP